MHVHIYIFAAGKIVPKDRDEKYPQGSIETIEPGASSSKIFSIFPKEFSGSYPNALYGFMIEADDKNGKNSLGEKYIDTLRNRLLKQIWQRFNGRADFDNFQYYSKKGKGSPAVIFQVEIELTTLVDLHTGVDALRTIDFKATDIVNVLKAYGFDGEKFIEHDLSVPVEFIYKYDYAFDQAVNSPAKKDSKKSAVISSDEKQGSTDKQFLEGCIAVCDCYLEGELLRKYAHVKEVTELKTTLTIELNSDAPDFSAVLNAVKKFQKTIMLDILAKNDTFFSRGKKQNSAGLAQVLLLKLQSKGMQKVKSYVSETFSVRAAVKDIGAAMAAAESESRKDLQAFYKHPIHASLGATTPTTATNGSSAPTSVPQVRQK